MLEAQVAIVGNQSGTKQPGDIIVVALPGHPWGTQDAVEYVIVEWDDPALESVLVDRRQRGESWPVTSLPYAEFA